MPQVALPLVEVDARVALEVDFEQRQVGVGIGVNYALLAQALQDAGGEGLTIAYHA